MDEMPLIELLDMPYHEMSEEERLAFIQALRSARVNTHVLVTKIEKEAKPREKTTTKSAPRLDISDLL
jgi:GTP-binding protein EngB required for normal cell division